MAIGCREGQGEKMELIGGEGSKALVSAGQGGWHSGDEGEGSKAAGRG